MILFVLVVTVSVSVYWMMDKPGFLGGLLRKYGKKFIYDFIVLVVGEWRNRVAKNPYARANQQAGRTASHASSNRIIRFFRWIGGKILKSVRDSSSFVFMTIVWISITVLIISIAIFIALIVTAVILTIGFLGFAILGIGASLNLIDFCQKSMKSIGIFGMYRACEGSCPVGCWLWVPCCSSRSSKH
jgi:hypothetical protein